MTLDEAIKICEDNAAKIGGNPQSDYHASFYKQVAEWLEELQEIELQKAAPRLGSIEEYHNELARCKTAFWSCNRRCMDAEEQYRRKADELRKAQQQIAEYKRLLKAAVEDINAAEACDTCGYYPVINSDACQKNDCYKWRYADEVEKLLNS